jgi:TPP-dependent 2-oxoacid decarboxylase
MSAARAMSRERNTKTFRTLVGLATGIIVVGVVATALTIWAWRRDTTEAAIRNIGDTAAILAEQTSRSIQSMDLVLSDLQDRLRAMGATTPDGYREVSATKEVYDILVDRLQHLSQATVIALVDSSGNVLNSTRSWRPPPLNLGDRNFFLPTAVRSSGRSRPAKPQVT